MTLHTYQCDFRPGKSTIDQIFTIFQILEKSREMRTDKLHLYATLATSCCLNESTLVLEAFDAIPDRSRGRPSISWKDQVGCDLV